MLSSQSDVVQNFLLEPADILKSYNEFYRLPRIHDMVLEFLHSYNSFNHNDFFMRVKYMPLEDKDKLIAWIEEYKQKIAAKKIDQYSAQELFLLGNVTAVLIPSSYKKVRELMERAAGKGLAIAQTDMAEESDDAKAAMFYEQAALTGDRRAITGLGELCARKEDYVGTLKYYQVAASKDCPAAYHNMGALYNSGKGVEKDIQIARACFAKAASLGNPRAFLSLGLLYEFELNDEDRARQCYKVITDDRYASEEMLSFHLKACMYLAELYTRDHTAQDAIQNIAKASQLLTQALLNSFGDAPTPCRLSYKTNELRNEIEKQLAELKSLLKSNILAQPFATNINHLFASKACTQAPPPLTLNPPEGPKLNG